MECPTAAMERRMKSGYFSGLRDSQSCMKFEQRNPVGSAAKALFHCVALFHLVHAAAASGTSCGPRNAGALSDWPREDES